MTVLQLHAYGRGSGICPECHYEVGNLAKHLPACRRRMARFYAQSTEQDWIAVERAVAHVAPHGLTPSVRFRRSVTELSVARVFLLLERGVEIVQGGPRRWFCVPAGAMGVDNLVRAVDEMVCTGLARGVSESLGTQMYRVYLKAAPVHLRSAQDRLMPACDAEAMRFRLVDHPDLADCRACLNRIK
jgi:hypothetical protein